MRDSRDSWDRGRGLRISDFKHRTRVAERVRSKPEARAPTGSVSTRELSKRGRLVTHNPGPLGGRQFKLRVDEKLAAPLVGDQMRQAARDWTHGMPLVGSGRDFSAANGLPAWSRRAGRRITIRSIADPSSLIHRESLFRIPIPSPAIGWRSRIRDLRFGFGIRDGDQGSAIGIRDQR